MNIRPLVVQREGTRIYLGVKFSVTGPKVRDIWEKTKTLLPPRSRAKRSQRFLFYNILFLNCAM